MVLGTTWMAHMVWEAYGFKLSFLIVIVIVATVDLKQGISGAGLASILRTTCLSLVIAAIMTMPC